MMDIISYFVLGAAVGSLLCARKAGNYAVICGGLSAMIPLLDDIVALFFFDMPTSLYVSGGFSHSIVFCVLVAPIVGWFIYRYINKECTVVRWSVLVLFSMLSHCLLDLLSISGVGFLEPFTHRRYAMSVIADNDIFIAIPLSIACIAVWLINDRRHKAMISWFGFFLFSVYVVFIFLNKLSIQSDFEKKLQEKEVRYSRIEVFPISGSMFMWNCIAQDRDGFWMCNQSNLSKNDFELNLVLRNDYYLFDIEQELSVQKIIAYTRSFYSIEPQEQNSIVLRDLRYGRKDLDSKSPFTSSYSINKDADSVIIVPIQ